MPGDVLYEVVVALYAGERSMLLATGGMRAAGWALGFAFAHSGGLYQVVYARVPRAPTALPRG